MNAVQFLARLWHWFARMYVACAVLQRQPAWIDISTDSRYQLGHWPSFTGSQSACMGSEMRAETPLLCVDIALILTPPTRNALGTKLG